LREGGRRLNLERELLSIPFVISPTEPSLEALRGRVIRRWERALRHIADQDEGEILEIANSMDEFCEAAARARAQAIGDEAWKELRCRYCPFFPNPGDCLGFIGGLNHAVLNAHWNDAWRLVEDHLKELARAAER
jgi:hypothetical protein